MQASTNGYIAILLAENHINLFVFRIVCSVHTFYFGYRMHFVIGGVIFLAKIYNVHTEYICIFQLTFLLFKSDRSFQSHFYAKKIVFDNDEKLSTNSRDEIWL